MKLDATIDGQRLKKPFRIWLNGEDVSHNVTKVEVDESGAGRFERVLCDPETRKLVRDPWDGGFIRYWEEGRVQIESWNPVLG